MLRPLLNVYTRTVTSRGRVDSDLKAAGVLDRKLWPKYSQSPYRPGP